MPHLRINGNTIRYDNKLDYDSIGVVGSGHGGEVWDVYPFNPGHRLGYERRKRDGSFFTIELGEELRLVKDFLRTGFYHGDNGVKHLTEADKPAFERTTKLYHEVLAALRGE